MQITQARKLQTHQCTPHLSDQTCFCDLVNPDTSKTYPPRDAQGTFAVKPAPKHTADITHNPTSTAPSNNCLAKPSAAAKDAPKYGRTATHLVCSTYSRKNIHRVRLFSALDSYGNPTWPGTASRNFPRNPPPSIRGLDLHLRPQRLFKRSAPAQCFACVCCGTRLATHGRKATAKIISECAAPPIAPADLYVTFRTAHLDTTRVCPRLPVDNSSTRALRNSPLQFWVSTPNTRAEVLKLFRSHARTRVTCRSLTTNPRKTNSAQTHPRGARGQTEWDRKRNGTATFIQICQLRIDERRTK